MQLICEVCGVEFPKIANLKRHLEKFHNIVHPPSENTAGFHKWTLGDHKNLR